MAMPRLDGSTSFMRSPPISRSPAVIGSNPAIILSSVDFPQPDGPTKTTNSLRLMSRSTPLITSREPNDLRTPLSFTLLMSFPVLFHGAQHAFDEAALQQEEDDEGRQRGEDRAHHDDAEIGVVGRRQRLDDQSDGLLLIGLQHDQRPQIIVPVGHENDDDRRRVG